MLLLLLLLLTYNDNFENVHKHMGRKLTQNNTTAANTVHSWIAVSNEYTNPAKEFSFSLLILLFVHATAQYGHACKLSLFPKICVHFSARLIHRCVMCMHVCSVLSEIYFYRHFAKHFRSFVPFVRVFSFFTTKYVYALSFWRVVWNRDSMYVYIYADFIFHIHTNIYRRIFVANDENSYRTHKISYRSSLLWKPNTFIPKTIIKKVKRNDSHHSRFVRQQEFSVILYRSSFSLPLLMLLLSILFKCCVCVEYANLNAQQSDAYEYHSMHIKIVCRKTFASLYFAIFFLSSSVDYSLFLFIFNG